MYFRISRVQPIHNPLNQKWCTALMAFRSPAAKHAGFRVHAPQKGR